ncbi:MAG: tRNA (N(6)-L-threonylcarbamoyladenosine(37)-C(2))-methylthiotransferase [Theionarchaea archaeon]|nr:tRNA (N(6)-L-threonylcarbamoyladenosine(37)-C(2))-methylthiotransferase [Theionarchaea archaeon]MBU7000659.1 tRNA (N(6)-L-threonylcarbamoyladenosine(37)-C(2))-methylthiotransferase [Theionarchaea archaeon]MBU7021021.1 tRNA (N(6)-L-threonylcarbamoyladenosine(37)-C(2))-methylthiotransferase [Theionarchaea archaeon]MBU7035695.1 tRNA (N(6)-L-threonylcarbamoyladenosine(37)-C(2))-methylthiotransferase [Theionarchaea archaeon]MBU7040893.1 tRNA (N(6)-L-threonylcarbamoyladenosine(37)-C(2))-methylthio
MSIYLETYGCTMNKADSEIIKALLRPQITESLEEADIAIINSCGVKGPTEHKIRKRIEEIKATNKPLIVAGCLPKISDLDVNVVGTNVYDIVEAVQKVREGSAVHIIRDEKKNKLCYPRVGDGVNAIIPISEGCLGSCTYCAARFARGHLYSYPLESIVKTAREFISNGYKELQITSQDTGCYGTDLDAGERLHSLLEKLASLEGKFRIRVGMMNPNHTLDILEDLVSVYRHDKIYKFLHIPVQSGNDHILQAMNRKYTVDEFLTVCRAFRTEFPELYLCTDVIVGFPTETEEQFHDTLALVKKINPDKINVTRFSPRPKTEASKMPQIPDWIKKERSRLLYKLRMDISLSINRRYVGESHEVLINQEGTVSPTMIGRLSNYKPVVCVGSMGSFSRVTITGAAPTYLKALQ